MDFIKQVPISLLTVEERRNWRDRWEKVIACHSCYFNKRNGYFLYIFFFFCNSPFSYKKNIFDEFKEFNARYFIIEK